MWPSKPTFSVIMPTFNRCYVLWRAINSVLNQTYPHFELIIIDDASTDDTEKQVKLFTDPRIKYFKLKTNKGPSGARNFGLTKSIGKYIAYLDSDNEWHKDYLETIFKAFQNHKNKQIVFTKKNYRLNIINEKGGKETIRDEFTNHNKYFDLKRLWQRRIIIDVNTMCHKKSVLKKVGTWDENLDFWEDWEWTLRASKFYPNGFMYLNRSLVDYEQTLDFTEKEKHFKKWIEAERYVFEKHKDHPLIEHQDWLEEENKNMQNFEKGRRPSNQSTMAIIEFLRAKKP